jgi:hypothetical protein
MKDSVVLGILFNHIALGSTLLFFTNIGKITKLRVFLIPGLVCLEF